MASDRQYAVRFEGNQSKRWDGKEVWLEAEVLDELYDASELVDGANVVVPFRGKGGKITHWKAIFVEHNKKQEKTAVTTTTEPTADKGAAATSTAKNNDVNKPDKGAATVTTKNNNGTYVH